VQRASPKARRGCSHRGSSLESEMVPTHGGWPMSDRTRLEVIDSDGHVIEPDTVWKDYSEPAYRDRLDRPGGGVQELGMVRAYPDAVAAGSEALGGGARGGEIGT